MTRILLVDDHKLMRMGLRALLEHNLDVEIVGDAGNGRMAVQMAERLQPDIVIMDAVMPILNGVEATRQIAAALPQVKILALSMHSEKRYVMEMLEAGATGYLLKTAALEQLEEAIDYVLRGELYLSTELAGTIIRNHVVRPSDRGPVALTPREREVVQLVAEGHTSRRIGETLHVSAKTVETHRRRIMRKLGFKSVAELTKYAIREGLTPL